MKSHYQIVIIGAGTAGIMCAAQLLKKDKSLDIAIIDPADKHYYQPAWTLVGAGTYDFEKTIKPMKDVIPPGAKWIQNAVDQFLPEESSIKTKDGKSISYDYLIVAPGLVYDYSLIEGLEEAIHKGVVCSNYIDPKYTWECIKNFKGGNAIFTQPTTPIKCGGAPQKIMYLAADYFRKNSIDQKSNVVFATPGSVIFGVKKISETLMKVIHRYNVHFKPFYAPVKIDANKKIAYFKSIAPDENKCVVNEGNVLGEKLKGDSHIEIPFDLLHLAPPQTAPKFVKDSSLVNDTGWLDVNINSMQHKRFPNIFGLGDVAALPTAKTGAAIRKQAPIVVDNIIKLIKGEMADNASYQGYSSCPLVTGYGKMVLAEFNYKNEFTPDPKLKRMLISDSSKEHWRLWMLKKYILPYLYWNKMLKGEDV
ncbi:FAD-dependent oxidoreductase [Belliella kenyensis]|uniref:FAD-dependent oxidoreductase n=1 Tax=Belliella kenyensis TaxID=1472724 RepID=A0ABV8EKN1_9BACT|nr:FAD/NAD(P)-binding oxidoreductase [Belliella kenyensis]MCH7400461.1 NAD(P)/FAD-dependent oxidoreductase [Belliella kenyensis]MDN3604523.1 FAD/NAD(P)-binding oxidoreductase [Belliella kenyensis]